MGLDVDIHNVPALGKPLGQYSHLTRLRGASETFYIAGMLSTDPTGKSVGEGFFERQATQVFANIETALRAEQMDWANVVQFTTYLVHSQDIPRFMDWRNENFPKLFPSGAYPPNTLLIIDRLVKEEFLLEVQTIAAK